MPLYFDNDYGKNYKHECETQENVKKTLKLTDKEIEEIEGKDYKFLIDMKNSEKLKYHLE
jgi:hypothetical protein